MGRTAHLEFRVFHKGSRSGALSVRAHGNGRSGGGHQTAAETVYISRGEGRTSLLLRILGRRWKGGYTVLDLAPQRRRCQRGGCLRLVDVPAAFCLEHERRAA
jgi:hypothetical protein